MKSKIPSLVLLLLSLLGLTSSLIKWHHHQNNVLDLRHLSAKIRKHLHDAEHARDKAADSISLFEKLAAQGFVGIQDTEKASVFLRTAFAKRDIAVFELNWFEPHKTFLDSGITHVQTPLNMVVQNQDSIKESLKEIEADFPKLLQFKKIRPIEEDGQEPLLLIEGVWHSVS